MIREKEAVRVDEWVREAVASGARVVTGGTRQGAMYAPTIVADVKPDMRISCDELFGPAVAVSPFTDIDEAIALANDTNYGLAAGIFTENLEWARRFAREVQSGNLHAKRGPHARSARAMGSARSPATFSSSTRLAPLATTSTARWLWAPRNTRDFAICSTRQPTARAASAAVRAGCGSATTEWPPPTAASASCTR